MIGPFYMDDAVTLYNGDCREVLRGLAVRGGALAQAAMGLGGSVDGD